MMNNIMVKGIIGAGAFAVGAIARPGINKMGEKIHAYGIKRKEAKEAKKNAANVIDIAGYLTDHEDTEEAVLEFVN